MSGEGTVRVQHQRVGWIRLPADEVLHFRELPGFPEARRFALLGDPGDSPFLWLCCLDRLDLAFAVTDPRVFFPDYAPELAPEALAAVGAESATEVQLLALLSIQGDRGFLNLAAPLLVNRSSRHGIQLILEGGGYELRAPLPGASGGRPASAAGTQMESKPQR